MGIPFSKRLAEFLSTPFFRGSFTYLSGSVLNAVLPLLILPVLTRYLTPTDFGFVATATVLIQILTVFIGVNAYGLFARSHFDGDSASMQKLLSTGMLLSAIVAGIFFILIPFIGKFIGRVTEFPDSWLPAVVFVAVATVVQNNYLAMVQARSEPKRYIFLQALGGALNLGIALWLVVGWRLDWHGRMWALIASQLIIALICLHGMVFRLGLLRIQFSRDSYRQLVAFGVPLIPHVIGGWVMTMAARLYLNNLASVADTGLFSMAYSLTSPMALVVGAANNAYVPTLFAQLSNTGDWDRVRLCKILLLVSAVLPLLAVICTVAVRWGLPLVVGPRFHGATDYVFWMALTYAVQGVYFIFGNFVLFSKKTSIMTWRADFLGGVVLLIACPALIHWNGAVGAAQAVCLAFTASTIGCITAARKAFPMPWGTALVSLVGVRPSLN